MDNAESIFVKPAKQPISGRIAGAAALIGPEDHDLHETPVIPHALSYPRS